MKKWIGLAAGVLLGALLGYTQLLCPDGRCAISGSWYGGAIWGALLGYWFLGGCPACSSGASRVPSRGETEEMK